MTFNNELGINQQMGIIDDQNLENRKMQGINYNNRYIKNMDILNNMDDQYLMSIGFSGDEINALKSMLFAGERVTIMGVQSGFGVDYETAKRLKYMYDIVCNKIEIDSIDDFAKHLRKMFGSHRRIGIQDLMLSSISKVERKAVVAGIPKGPFFKLNSTNYVGANRLYDVVSVYSENIVIETDRKPVLKYKQDRFISGVLEIKDIVSDKKITISINKKNCKLCNRFIIVASLKRPEFHLGMVEILCIEGSKIYIYAKDIGTRDSISYNGGTQRVYDYGFYGNEIESKLRECTIKLYRHVNGVFATEIPANKDYKLITLEDKEIREDNDKDIEIEI